MIRVYLTQLPHTSSCELDKQGVRRAASLAAYSLLDFAYRDTLGEPLPPILRTENGKPYQEKNSHGVHFNLSHTDFYAAVLLSDEGECGIDIEGECGSQMSERIEKRFLSGITLEPGKIDGEPLFFLCDSEYKTKRELVPSTKSLEPSEKTNNGPIHTPEKKLPTVNNTLAYPDCRCDVRPTEQPTHADRSAVARLTEQPIDADRPAIARWTMLEAALKADGRGFGGYKEAGKIIPSVGIRHYEFYNGELIYISLAIKK